MYTNAVCFLLCLAYLIRSGTRCVLDEEAAPRAFALRKVVRRVQIRALQRYQLKHKQSFIRHSEAQDGDFATAATEASEEKPGFGAAEAAPIFPVESVVQQKSVPSVAEQTTEARSESVLSISVKQKTPVGAAPDVNADLVELPVAQAMPQGAEVPELPDSLSIKLPTTIEPVVQPADQTGEQQPGAAASLSFHALDIGLTTSTASEKPRSSENEALTLSMSMSEDEYRMKLAYDKLGVAPRPRRGTAALAVPIASHGVARRSLRPQGAMKTLQVAGYTRSRRDDSTLNVAFTDLGIQPAARWRQMSDSKTMAPKQIPWRVEEKSKSIDVGKRKRRRRKKVRKKRSTKKVKTVERDIKKKDKDEDVRKAEEEAAAVKKQEELMREHAPAADVMDATVVAAAGDDQATGESRILWLAVDDAQEDVEEEVTKEVPEEVKGEEEVKEEKQEEKPEEEHEEEQEQVHEEAEEEEMGKEDDEPTRVSLHKIDSEPAAEITVISTGNSNILTPS